ncbi:MAG TPA: NAD(P)-dependent oxidoreductase, partial [Nitrospira sp.]|nr:NAD(P)-dependent oxidoreductase [Nitrospira sp.]
AAGNTCGSRPEKEEAAMTPRLTIAVLGTGLLGRAIAARLHTVGHQVVAFNRTSAKALPLQREGIAVVGSADRAVSQADCALLLLADAAAIREVLFTSSCSSALKGKTIVQMGTIAPSESLGIQREVEQRGGGYCEAPVLGSLTEAKAGTLFVMMGGTGEQFASWSPLLQSLGREPRHIGPVGAAAALKLALNHLIAAETSAFALSLAVVQRSGIPVETFMGVLRKSALYAPTFDKKLPRLLKRDYEQPNFSTRHLIKDVRLFVHEAEARGLTTEALNGLTWILERTIAKGFGDVDYSALFEAVNPPAASTPPS